MNAAAEYLDIGSEVREALEAGSPVVALESTIITHGFPWPRNLELAQSSEAEIRAAGATPATIAILGGRLRAGLDAKELEQLAKLGPEANKCSRRDIPFIVHGSEAGATTVAATMIIAHLAGIQVFATGGIGGVHRGAQRTMDVSADLQELARTPVAVVCAGPKSIMDIGMTLEYLETHGVPVVGYGTDELPAFYTRRSGFEVHRRLDSAEEVAAVLKTKWSMGLAGGMVIANPVPESHAMDPMIMERLIEAALRTAEREGVTGKDLTPFLLAKIEELTGGESLDANVELVLNNARLAAEIAGAL
ncbi:MAG: pseudouridine-5-phosphate glycosidase [Xanthomonadales bacterium]|nr:pseudouridine-5'-phosphate glycosidase [Xanthomonadales bacterium]NIX12822.1 pseudouridine-5-phosphate glycosidase [Xanthomonadales bacterium]